MSQLSLDQAVIDYQTYRFGRRQRLYRGPAPDLSGRYVAFVGSEQTFGKFVETPYPAHVGKALGVSAFNLGVDGAGPGFFLADPVVLEACCRAEVCVIEVGSAWNLSNRLYTVGRRYNRRLRAVSDTLRALYSDVDFESYDMIGRLLENLYQRDPDRFKVVEAECRAAWVARMRLLLESVETRTLLLWFSERSPDQPAKRDKRKARVKFPDAVDREVLEKIRPLADAYVECVARPGGPAPGPARQVAEAAGLGAKASRQFPSQSMHDAAAEALEPVLKDMLS